MYESLEALAKIVTKTNRELAGNREKFASEIGLPEESNHMLNYDFGCKNRHAPAMREITSSPNSFEIWFSGYFLSSPSMLT